MIADIIVIGAGIAGVSVAANLAQQANVILLEREKQPGYHATGRSAAYYAPSYGNEVVQAISKASGPFFFNPPEGFSQAPLIRSRDAWFIGRADQKETLAELEHLNPELSYIDSHLACEQVPILRSDYLERALVDTGGGDLDVDALLQGYLKQFQGHAGTVCSGCEIDAMKYSNGLWTMTSGTQTYSAPIVVNAAGAWADDIAAIAGIGALGIQPFRRTACLVDLPPAIDAGAWPLIIDADEEFYFKPDAGLLLISPANESPSVPCDAQPFELDVAQAVDRISKATNLDIKRIQHKWAGLRSFASDRTFVAGFDPRAKGFFWLAGQGGYGVQSAPGLAALASHMITGAALSNEYRALSQTIGSVRPERLIL